MEVKDMLKQRRIELGLTQEDVARYVGVSETTVSRWESGNIANMRRSRIVALAEILQIPITAIMGWGKPETAVPVFRIEEIQDPSRYILPASENPILHGVFALG